MVLLKYREPNQMLTNERLRYDFSMVAGSGRSLIGAHPLTIKQYERVSALEGDSATLGCFVDGAEIQQYNVHWFKQLPESPPTYILQSNDSAVIPADPPLDRYRPIRNSSHAHYLDIINVTTHDSALYWCMISKHPGYYIWGEGTYLSVYGGAEAQAPSVFLMRNQASSDNSQPLLACSVSNFYPPVIEVTWKLDGELTPGISIAGPLRSKDNSYSMISILELPLHPRKNLSSISCEVRHDSSRTLISKDFLDCYMET
ncbi:immunoglobulin lambda-1 light chain-like [Gastrophryne carolinensis]